jgi:hypothetical protein
MLRSPRPHQVRSEVGPSRHPYEVAVGVEPSTQAVEVHPTPLHRCRCAGAIREAAGGTLHFVGVHWRGLANTSNCRHSATSTPIMLLTSTHYSSLQRPGVSTWTTKAFQPTAPSFRFLTALTLGCFGTRKPRQPSAWLI